MSFDDAMKMVRKELKNAYRTFDTDHSGTIEKH